MVREPYKALVVSLTVLDIDDRKVGHRPPLISTGIDE